MRRFRGTLVALVALALVLGLSAVLSGPEPEPADAAPALFRFEKEQLAGVRIERADRTLELRRTHGEWHVVGEAWRPSRSMVRRVAHQLHDLTARAAVVPSSDELGRYGLGADAVRVTLTLDGGRILSFEAGDPNPTGVSFYVRPLPGEAVYVVKKSAMDFFSVDVDEFRERRFAPINVDEADRIEAVVDGRLIALHRTGERAWRMSEPVAQDMERDEVRTMLGRTGALKALSFVADAPGDRARYGLEPPAHTVLVGASSGAVVTLHVGAEVPGTHGEQRYVYRVEDDAVYAARAGFLDVFRHEVTRYRRRTLIEAHEWDVQAYTATRAGEALRITRSSDDWRWPDGAPIAGSTPGRVASQATALEALAFHDAPVPDALLDAPLATLALEVEGGPRTITVGAAVVRDGEPRRYVGLDDDPTIYEVAGTIGDVIEDLFREHARKRARDTEKKDPAGVGQEQP